MQKTTFPSLPLSRSISRPPGPPTILTCSCSSSCFQASVASRNLPSPIVTSSCCLMVTVCFLSFQLVFTTVSVICLMPGSLSLCMVLPACTSLLLWYVLGSWKHSLAGTLFARLCAFVRFTQERMTRLGLFCLQVRLMLVLAPVMCILSGIGVSQVLTTYMKNLDVSRLDKKSKKQQDSTYPIKNEVVLPVTRRWDTVWCCCHTQTPNCNVCECVLIRTPASGA